MFNLTSTRYDNVNEAVEFCNNKLLNPDGALYYRFISEIQQSTYTMTDMSGSYIAGRILKFIADGHTINVKFYRSKNPWSSVKGYYTKSRPFDININTRKINRSVGSFIATLVHEMIHAVDGLDENDFGHTVRNVEGRDESAPYAIGELASELYGDKIPAADYPRTVRTPWYKRLWRWVF